MLSRTTTVTTAVVLAIIAVPVVWSVGYFDHPWRKPVVAIATGVVLVGAAVATRTAGAREEPPVPRWLTTTALAITVGALGAALVWALIDYLG